MSKRAATQVGGKLAVGLALVDDFDFLGKAR